MEVGVREKETLLPNEGQGNDTEETGRRMRGLKSLRKEHSLGMHDMGRGGNGLIENPGHICNPSTWQGQGRGGIQRSGSSLATL